VEKEAKVLNFSHPLTKENIQQIEKLLGKPVDKVIEVEINLDLQKPIKYQIRYLANKVGFSKETWQTVPLLIIPPSFSAAAVSLLAELHGRIGHFPAIIRLKPKPDSIPQQFEVAEIINLQAIRNEARLST